MPNNEETKPVFWESEDGDFYPTDSNNVLKCSVCGNWYKVKAFSGDKNICSPGCNLKLIEGKGQSNG
jgi:hypothetical protein